MGLTFWLLFFINLDWFSVGCSNNQFSKIYRSEGITIETHVTILMFITPFIWKFMDLQKSNWHLLTNIVCLVVYVYLMEGIISRHYTDCLSRLIFLQPTPQQKFHFARPCVPSEAQREAVPPFLSLSIYSWDCEMGHACGTQGLPSWGMLTAVTALLFIFGCCCVSSRFLL